MSSVDFKDIEEKALDSAKEKKKEVEIAEKKEGEKSFFSTEGWTKGPWIAFGVFVVIAIAFSIWVMF